MMTIHAYNVSIQAYLTGARVQPSIKLIKMVAEVLFTISMCIKPWQMYDLIKNLDICIQELKSNSERNRNHVAQ